MIVKWRPAIVIGLLMLAACGGTGATSRTTTIEFATQGLGAEGQATQAAVAAFEKANPNIHVSILTLSPQSDNAYQQLTQRFIAGSSTPDVITADVIWPATFAKSGWIMPLERFNPKVNDFFKGQIQGAQYGGKLYAMPWFINAQGLYYRTDLVPQAPTSPQEVTQDAATVMQKHPGMTGVAFAGDKYEGVVTTFLTMAGGFGGGLDLKNIDSPANVQTLTYMRNLISQDKVTPRSATSWQEPNLEQSYMSGQAVFALNWPYVFQEAEKAGSPVAGKTAWIPFPSSSGSSRAALGGDDLVINAKTQHADAAWKFIQFLDTADVQIQRAQAAGDPPAVQSAYTDQLFSQAPYFKSEQAVFNVVAPRPVTPLYPRISNVLQTQLNAALTDQVSPQAALSAAQQQINQIVSGGGS